MDQDDILCGGKNTNCEEILNFESFLSEFL
jgi:hypothetical protein